MRHRMVVVATAAAVTAAAAAAAAAAMVVVVVVMVVVVVVVVEVVAVAMTRMRQHCQRCAQRTVSSRRCCGRRGRTSWLCARWWSAS